MVVLLDVGQFGAVHAGIVGGLLVKPQPKSHPHKSETAYHHEGHFPAVAEADVLEIAGEWRYAERCHKSTDGASGIENRCSERAVALGKVFSGDFNGCWEITCLSHSEHNACCNEIIYAHYGYGRGYGARGAHHFQ